jgi:hypothetical protein
LRSFVAVFVAVLLWIESLAFAAGVPTAPHQDYGWPRQISKNGATLIYYQPQLDGWKDYKQLNARLAFSLTPQGGKNVLGVASVTAATTVTMTREPFICTI